MNPHDISQLLELEAQAIRNIPVSHAFEQAIQLILSHIHQRHGTLIASGIGKAGQVAVNVATTFASTGTPAYFLHPTEAQHGDLGILRPDDLLLLISNSGKTRELIELVELSRGIVPDIPSIVITSNPDSPLAQQASVCLHTGAPPEVCPLGLTPTTSTTVMSVIGDILVVSTMQHIRFSKSQYALRHHGGYLGSISRS
ncbi:MAG: SIS domain-containing protein [Tannerellaceae bacterium]|jgi:arabinose-5-phosphate isomerase|nr:SIS domain-containing protein [Tannerellaceae bacterium]